MFARTVAFVGVVLLAAALVAGCNNSRGRSNGRGGPVTPTPMDTPDAGDRPGSDGSIADDGSIVVTPGVCGDGTCNEGETCGSCPNDCGACSGVCGDGTCGEGEACGSCPADCGACSGVCGDGSCGDGETCSSCPTDCGSCGATCGDGVCTGGVESCSTCPTDCGSCAPTCGDGSCSAGETCSTCETDCGPCTTESSCDDPIGAFPSEYTPRCSTTTLNCISACADSDCSYNCIDADTTPGVSDGGGGTVDCGTCVNWQSIYCYEAYGCQSQVGDWMCCLEDYCPPGSSDTCAQTYCGTYLDAMDACLPSTADCSSYILECFPAS